MSSLILRNSPMRSIFENFFNESLDMIGQNTSTPSINVMEQKNEYEIEVAAPGYSRDSFNIEVQGNNLLISASNRSDYNANESNSQDATRNRSNESSEGKITGQTTQVTQQPDNGERSEKRGLQRNKSSSPERYHRKEFSYSSFERSMYLPENVNTDQIRASYENGILNITIPKREETKRVSKIVEIQ